MTKSVPRRTVVVESKLGYRMSRLDAARDRQIGVDVLTVPSLAARLAGGFCRPAEQPALVAPARLALARGGFEELEAARARPGMARAVLAALQRIWASGLDLQREASGSARLRDLLRIESEIRTSLPAGVLLPPDLLTAAMSRLEYAPAVLGPVHLSRLVDVDPLWRPLISGLASFVEVSWEAVGERDRSWFPRPLSTPKGEPPERLFIEICADPRSECVEALRWCRSVLSTGEVMASDVAIVAAETSTWDDHMVVLTSESELPVHFANGVPALSTAAGQACAALADIVLNGLSIERVLRLSRVSPQLSRQLPQNWSAHLPPEAGLSEVSHWEHALQSPTAAASRAEIAAVLLPVVRLLALGVEGAEAAGQELLSGKALALWADALRLAPPDGLELVLGSMRINDDRDPGNSVVWTSAAQMIGAPRRFMRLIGLSSGSWPRTNLTDPLLPNHLVDHRRLFPLPRIEFDRISFRALVNHPGAEVTTSRSRRSGTGSLLAKSALCTEEFVEVQRLRTRIPEHAFSTSDWLLANAHEAMAEPRFSLAAQSWSNWSLTSVTAHDGLSRAGHPAIERALAKVHSASGLRQLLRDPLRFVWERAVGMRMPDLDLQPLQMDAAAFGELVHELLRFTVDALEPHPGLVRAEPHEVDDALDRSLITIRYAWPLHRTVPPTALWLDTLTEARRRAHRALTLDERFGPGTRSWSEVGFGDLEATGNAPWPAREVTLPGSGLRLRGRIDRIDLKADGRSARITDYKTGRTPARQDAVVLGGGAELQRALYATAVRRLLPNAASIISRLVYLDRVETPFELRDELLESATATLLGFIEIAVEQLREGVAHPGPDAFSQFNDYRIALPANLEGYRNRKFEALEDAQSSLASLWRMP